MVFRDDEPCYTISVVARIIGLHAQTLRTYEREGLIRPSRSSGGIRMFSNRDVSRIREIKEWVDGLGLNLAGVATMTRLRAQVALLQSRQAELEEENALLRREVVARRAGRSAFRALSGDAVGDSD
ncbi:MAG: MerR family transcriptional regulator [Chloroflexi bacterium]|nr:MerR family transcriptional regulator [Chloroflexota bacterium]MCH8221860.1 MerR family transcriptional regulator [Chloroflexota bacterium]